MITLRPGVWFLGVVLLLGPRVWASQTSPAPATRMVTDERFTELQANLTSADAQLELALAYDERREPAKAAEHYQVAADAGIGAAELRLGVLAELGEGISQSYEVARTHYERAVSLGVPEANLRLGMLYLEGWGVAANPANAIVLIERAAEAGYVPAQKILSEIYFIGMKVDPDLKRALKWAERAAEHDVDAATTAGVIQQRAAKLPQDLKLAREWYQLAAEQDYTRGMLAMASTFFRAGASFEDQKLGARWLELAADGGNSAAAFYLAGFYLLSPFRSESGALERARTRLEQAAAAGENQAAEVLQWEKTGQPLAMAFRYVFEVPYDQRHVQRFVTDPKYAEDKGGNRLPRPLKLVWPVYPAALRLAGTEGEVLVEFTLDTTGRVRNPKIVRTTHPGFGESALAAMASARFLPAKRNHRLVNVRMQQPVYYKLSDVHTKTSDVRDQAAGVK